MAQPNPASPGQGGQNRKPNPGGNPPKPRIILSAVPQVNLGPGNSYTLLVDVSAYLSGQPMKDQEVTLKEGVKTLDAQPLDINGETLLKASGHQTDQEELKVFRVCLTGTPEIKNINVTIPAIKKPAVPKKKNIPVAVTVTPDPTTNMAEVTFSCLVSEDGIICSYQRIALWKGITQLEAKQTENNGRATFKTTEPMAKVDTTVLFRVILPGLTDEVEANVVIPAEIKKAKDDNDPEEMVLYRFHDPKKPCRFKILARVTKVKGVGIVTPITFFFKGAIKQEATDNQGFYLVDIPDVIDEGDDYDFSAFVSGIAERAVVKIKRRKRKESFRKKKQWLFTTNNGRALLLLLTTITLWLALVFVSLHNSPVINANLFRDKETGLSGAETLYNESAEMVSKKYVIADHKEDSGLIPGWWFVVGVILSIVSVPYLILSWREEVLEGIEDGIESILSKNHDRASDPRLEKWMKYYGMMHTVKNPVATTINSGTNASPEPAKEKGGHPSLMTLFKLDLLSDVIVEILPAIGRKLFGK